VTGIFPIDKQMTITLPANPTVAVQASSLSMGPIGIMTSGSVLFNAVDLQGRDAVAHEIQDECAGHPEVTGKSHYHNLSDCIADNRDKTHSDLVGYALDGFGTFGKYGEDGRIMTNEDLDEYHGHTHSIMWDGKMVEMFHYHATNEYPYTIGAFRGMPVASDGDD
jgi:hypothetical protein